MSIAPRLKLCADIAEVSARQWDVCAPAHDNPFLSHAFLHALEASGSVAPSTGWLPRHLTAVDDKDNLLGCMPLYLKAHSQGEYVFDHEWAYAFERAGGRYYPKLQACVPFTPVTGPRILARDRGVETLLLKGATQMCEQMQCSSLHFSFLEEKQWDHLGAHGLLLRQGQQFHWRNAGYQSFDDFLESLSARKRGNIRRERAGVAAAGVEIEWLRGEDITPADWDDFYRFYLDTAARKWNHAYLTRDFFERIASMGPSVLLIAARRGGRMIAATLNFLGADTFFGRYWGCSERVSGLHFELCYYQAISFAICHSLANVEAGAQGMHKLARGYLPVRTFSAHYIVDERLRVAVRDYLAFEGEVIDDEIALLASHSPFRHTDTKQEEAS
ncbi:MAG: GNAT family N-acetyltransferase [Hyphomicrobiales bacterium]|nr:GNAT family N-acetyltransferase [Hyphomicrobiales bacterium]